MVDDSTDVMTFDETRAMLKMRRSSLYRLTAAEEIPHYKIKRRVWFSRTAVQAWVDSKTVRVREAPAMSQADGDNPLGRDGGGDRRGSPDSGGTTGGRTQERPQSGPRTHAVNGSGRPLS
jgi:excisionase family DNA binding protein